MNIFDKINLYKKFRFTFKTPIIVVVKAVLYAVHKTVEYIRINPIKQDSRNVEMNITSNNLGKAIV